MADFRPYVDKVLEPGIEDNCQALGEPCVAGIEMGDRGVQESLACLAETLPDLDM